MHKATPDKGPPLLTPDEVAALLKVTPKTLEGWREKGTGPAFVRLGHRTVRYSTTALKDWLDKSSSTPTANAS